MDVTYGAPQGSIYGPKAYNLYIRPAGRVISLYDISHTFYADDGQLVSVADAIYHTSLFAALSTVIEPVKSLGRQTRLNKLKLYENKAQFMVKSSKRYITSYKIDSIQ